MWHHHVRVHNLPQDVDEGELAGSTVIVIDVLRATTTICQALASGACEVIPFRGIDETLSAAMAAGRDQVVLGGERGGGRIDGFDLGNSPAEYTPDAVAGRRVLITTTNGTQALYHARFASRVVIGALVNLSAVVKSVKSEPRLEIVCAGTDSRETDEDILAAGALIHQLCYLGELPATENISKAAAMAGAKWSLLCAQARAADRPVSDELAVRLRDTPGGRNLIEIGSDRDLVDCAQIDRFNIAPELDVRQWRIAVP